MYNMRNILVKFINSLVEFLIKVRYKLLKNYVDPAAVELLARWKKTYPEIFGGVATPLIGRDNKEVFTEPPISDDISDILATPHKEL